MRIAIISDIHANFYALESVFANIDKQKRRVDEYFCLGDVIGYGSEPVKVIELLAERIPPENVVTGNHEDLYVGLDDFSFNASAMMAMHYEKYQISTSSKAIDYLKQVTNSPLDLVRREVKNTNFILSHNGPGKNYDMYHYPWMDDVLLPNLMKRFQDTNIINDVGKKRFWNSNRKNIFLIGHSHIPMVFCENLHNGHEKSLVLEKTYEFKDKSRDFENIVINPGSVGYSRDGDTRASYVIIDLQRKVIELHRVSYDIEQNLKSVVAMGKWLSDNLPPNVGLGDVDKALSSLIQSMRNACLPSKAPDDWKTKMIKG